MFVRPVEFETVFGTKVTVEATQINVVEEFPSGICVIVHERYQQIITDESYGSVLERIKNAPSVWGDPTGAAPPQSDVKP